MRCPVCGYTNLPEARYCAQCGAELTSSGLSLAPGQTMNRGQYRVVRQLGKGGMGAIYLAQNTQAFDRLCVIKEMIAYYEPGKEREAQERFEHEARILATLKHPGIPDMYGYFSERGRNYIVMEYIEGDNLEHGLTHPSSSGEILQGAPLSLDLAVRYAIEICRALEHLAQVKPEPVVHCDIKPANIIIDRNSQQAVLVDFGTAKARYPSGPSEQPDTKRASVYGTVGYAPPELYRGQAVPKSDVFSLAATVYHLLTDDDPREHPFKWPAMERIPDPPRSVIERALAAEVDERLDAGRFRRELEAFRAAQADAVRPLTFPEGNLATTLTGMLDLSLKYWEYACQILTDGSLDAWLRQTLHDPVAADRVREALTRYPASPDAALDEFVRGLSPRVASAQLALSASQVDLGLLPVGGKAQSTLTLTNLGPGGSHGTIVSADPWLTISPDSYALGPNASVQIALELGAVGSLPVDRPLGTRITVRSSTGQNTACEVLARMGRRTLPKLPPPAATTQQTTPTAAASPAKAQRPAPISKAIAHRSMTRIAAALGSLLLIVVALFALRSQLGALLPSPLSVNQGVAALQQGDWQRAIPQLSRLDPKDKANLREVARLLDEATVPIPAGALQMGREDGATDERPVHEVSLVAFSLDRFEVTNAQYQRFVDETGHAAPTHWSGGHYPAGKALHPVVHVTWEDARAYAAWAGKRLPTEAEWEWAARGPEGSLFPWGNTVDPTHANSGHPDRGGTTSVGSFPTGANAQGAMDLAGNVREWTLDRYGPYRVPHTPPAQGSRIAVRGSSWRTYNDVASARESVEATADEDDLGFRCVR